MDPDTLSTLREHYDTVDTSAEMDDGHWETDVDPDPMVTTSLRLPKSLLDWVRAQAAADHVKPTALIRQWLEERRADGDQTVTTRLTRLENHVFHGDQRAG